MLKRLLSFGLMAIMLSSFIPHTFADDLIPTAGLDLWLESDSGITLDPNGGVSSWANKVSGGSVIAVTQNAEANRPTITTAAQGGRTFDAVHFKGCVGGTTAATTSLQAALAESYSGPMTIFMIAEALPLRTGESVPNQNALLFSTYSGTNNGSKWVVWNDGTTPANYGIMGKGGGGDTVAHTAANYQYTQITVSGNYDDNPTYYNIRSWQDGVAIKNLWRTNTSYGMDTISDYRITNGQYKCNIAAVLVYRTELNDADRQTVESYLHNKYVAVDNVAPSLVDASIPSQGYYMDLQFNKALQGTIHTSDFTVSGLPSGVAVQSVNYKSGDNGVVRITFNNVIPADAIVTVSYNGTTLTSLGNVALASFSNASVTNASLQVPGSIPTTGLDLWLESDYGVHLDAATNTKVERWDNKAPTANNPICTALVQTTDANKPTVTTGGLNGINTIHFKGKVNGVETSSLVGDNTVIVDYAGDMTYFILCKQIAPDTSAGEVAVNDGSLFKTTKGGGGLGHSLRVWLTNGTPTSYGITAKSGGYTTFENPKLGQFTVLNLKGFTDTATGQYCFSTYQDGAQAKMNGYTRSDLKTNNYDKISSYWLAEGKFKGDIAAVLVYKRALSDIERTMVYNYLNDKYMVSAPYELAGTAYTYKTAEGTPSEVPVAGGKVVVNTIAKNNSSECLLSSNVIVATYSVNQLADLKIVPINYLFKDTPQAISATELNLPNDLTGAQVKLFLWDSVGNMKPLIGASMNIFQ